MALYEVVKESEQQMPRPEYEIDHLPISDNFLPIPDNCSQLEKRILLLAKLKNLRDVTIY